MSKSLPTNLGPHGEKPAADTPVVEPGIEVVAQEFWARNRNFIYAVIVAAVLVIAGREGWTYFSASREADAQADYAKAAGNSDRLAAFAAAHAGHALAGVAYLQAADDKFSSADYKAAATFYAKAAASLTDDGLVGRAKLGAAVSQLDSGDQAGGEAALKALSDDTGAFKAARAEAAYHLASLALGAGRTEDARKLADQVSRIDATSPWAQRATVLQAGLPAETGKPAATASTGITFKPVAPAKP
jgi:hypothetical protein